MNTLNVVLVDDEQEACDNLRSLLSRHAPVEVVGVAHSTADAEILIKSTRPEVVFLDIEMPGENAFQFLERISDPGFEIVFVTAYDEYAIKALKLNAVDYLLKPIDIDELAKCVLKLEERRQYRRIIKSYSAALPAFTLQPRHKQQQQQVVLRNHNQYEIVSLGDIHYIEAMGRYATVYFMKDKVLKGILMSRSIAEYEELLPEAIFFRIHRSYLVNGKWIKQIVKNKDGETFAVLGEKLQLPISRRRNAEVFSFLKNNSFHED